MPTKKTTTKKAVAQPSAKPAKTKKTVVSAAAVSELAKKYRSHKGDNGSTDVQIIGLTEKIGALTGHLTTHAKDHDSRRGLLIMVGKRRRLLNYLKRQDETTYGKLVADLGLRR